MNLLHRHSAKLALAGALALGIGFGIASGQPARAATPAQYIVQVGAGGPANTDLLQIAPSTLQVHRGDMVTWVIGGFHNVHLNGELKPLVVMQDVNGSQTPVLNGEVAFPYGAENGKAYTGQESNSGLPLPPNAPVYTLSIDVAAGTTFAVVCDVHPGMAGSVSVVDDATAIPSPYEVSMQAAAEIGGTVGAAQAAYFEAFGKSSGVMMSVNGKAMVQAGNDVGRAATNLFFPNVTVIKAGESVTWNIPQTGIEPHTISSPAVYGQEFLPVEQQGKPPVLVAGPSVAPLTPSGSTVKKADSWSSGLIGPGQSFELIFAEPGVYPYACNIHPGMNGTLVVEAK